MHAIETFEAGPWVVIAPHDDDAALGCGMLLGEAIARGIAVHVVIVTDGAMGYDDPSARATLVRTRAAEAQAAYAQLGVASVRWLGFADGSLSRHQGCFPPDQPPSLAQALVSVLRELAPRVVFWCDDDDLHPDHRVTASEAAIATFWASARIWLERGTPIVSPQTWTYPVYGRTPSRPARTYVGTNEALARKLGALQAFASQTVIAELVERIAHNDPIEHFGRPRHADRLLASSLPADVSPAWMHDMALLQETADATPEPWAPLVQAFECERLLVVGEGSSLALPGPLAHACAWSLKLGARVLACGAANAHAQLDAADTVLVLSNSGETKETIELAAQARAQGLPVLALMGATGPTQPTLVEYASEHKFVLPRAEQAVPATASVWGMGLAIACAAHACAQVPFTVEPLATWARNTLATSRPAHVRMWAGAARIVWAGASRGVCDELALKTWEILGYDAISLPGTAVLHGAEEVLRAGDVVAWFSPHASHGNRMRALQDHARVLELHTDTVHFPTGLHDLAQVLLGVDTLAHAALARGRDPAHPLRVRKVGHPYVIAASDACRPGS